MPMADGSQWQLVKLVPVSQFGRILGDGEVLEYIMNAQFIHWKYAHGRWRTPVCQFAKILVDGLPYALK